MRSASGRWLESLTYMPANTIFEPRPAAALAVAGSELRYPVHRVYCVGRNYAAHAREMGQDGREAPFFFSKPADAPTQADTVAYPPATAELHHEVELVVALGRGGRDISEQAALEHVFGYAVGVDLTRRDLQVEAKRQGRPWDLAKGFDESAPLSEIVPAADCGHPGHGRIELSVDRQVRQRGDLGDMIWPVAAIIAALSRYFILQPGDLVFTGTPDGVGPLAPGAVVVCGIEGIAAHRFTMGQQP